MTMMTVEVTMMNSAENLNKVSPNQKSSKKKGEKGRLRTSDMISFICSNLNHF